VIEMEPWPMCSETTFGCSPVAISIGRTPTQLVPLRERVRKQHRAQLLQVHEAINERFGTTGASADYVNVFYAASQMALMEWVGRKEFSAPDRARLRQL
jgi:hypothetical protein